MAGMEGILVFIATCLLYTILHSKQITVFVHTWCGLLKINLSLCIQRVIGDATDIELSTENGKQAEVSYDLQGRRVQKAEKGVYIVNGKKVVMK